MQLDDQDSESSDEEDTQKKSKVYVPPKVAAVPYGEFIQRFFPTDYSTCTILHFLFYYNFFFGVGADPEGGMRGLL